ncbi:MAG: hypothetical protein AB1586_07705 [Pseudomonadota bacterium]
MSNVIEFSVNRTQAATEAGALDVDGLVRPMRDLGWLLYAIIEIEIAQAVLTDAITRLPASSVRNQLTEDHADLKRQMRMVRLSLEEVARSCEAGQAAQKRP